MKIVKGGFAMRLKRVLAGVLAGVLALSLVGCGSKGDAPSGKDPKSNKLVIWTLSEDLKTFAEKYMEDHEGVTIETVIIPPSDYPTKLTAALRGKASTPDILVGEPQMLPDFMEAGFFEDLSQEPYNAEEYKDLLVDYVWEAGKDPEGVVRTISYQATPGGIFYRRDVAKDVYGTDDPATISEKFKDFDTVEKTAKEMRDKGYRIFSDPTSLRWFAVSDPWVKDGVITLTDEKYAYMDTAVSLYKNKLVAFAPEWSSAWFASMKGEIPLNADWQELEEVDEKADKTDVFAFVLPSWGSLIIRDNAKDNAGNFGVCAGPTSFFGGGTFVGINSYSKNKDLAWDFIKYTTLNEETSKWWSEKSNGDIVSMKTVLESYKDKENETYGNQKTYQFFYDEAQNIDYSSVTGYDDVIKAFWGVAIESIQKGEMTKEQAVEDFYKKVQSAYPELKKPE